MAKYKTCPECGAHLDFNEKCDCIKGKWGGSHLASLWTKKKAPPTAIGEATKQKGIPFPNNCIIPFGGAICKQERGAAN